MERMKWYDVILYVIFAAIFILLIIAVTKIRKPEPTSHLEAENAALRQECDSLQSIVRRLDMESKAFYVTIDSLNSLISSNTLKQHENRTTYEVEIFRVDAMPDDELYKFFTDYINRQQ
jgi:uncharacterized protein YpmS